MILADSPLNTKPSQPCYDCLKIDLHGISKKCCLSTSKMANGSIYYTATF